MSEEPDPGPTRCGFVAIIGAPNAGKSTLVNLLVGAKVAIVTHKVQTTRFPVRGVAMRGQAQLILVDTPGVFEPKRRLDRAMVRSAITAMEDADAVVHLVDAPAHAQAKSGADRRCVEDAARVSEKLKALGRPYSLALNKVDAMPRDALLGVTQALYDPALTKEVFMISAKTGDGVEKLGDWLAGQMPESPWHYPADQTADAPSRLIAAEVTREKLMLRLHEELPYETMVETESWQERKDGSVRIDQIVYVAREGQRKITIGDKAATIKAIGALARAELEQIFDRRVHLFLFVKVRENWSDEPARYTAMGLDFES
jgi:GTPase